MKLARFLSGLAPALAIAVVIGFAAPSIAQSPSPDASVSSPAAAAPAAAAACGGCACGGCDPGRRSGAGGAALLFVDSHR